ncbi:MAG: transglutaminase-like domain-containing protein, partial [Candidatus Aminicenantes bacterium]|nr:transglutaminase-like domain-containing protein [Candidatus Aminicenantes bacterium]
RLVAGDSPQIKPEEYMPPLAEIASRAVFSTFPDWKEAARAFSDSFFNAAAPTRQVKEFTETLIKGTSGRNGRTEKIFSFVAKDVRSVRFSFGEGGFEVHAAETVLKNRYGDWKDKSALLVAMLEAAGIEAYPVLVHSRAVPPEEDVPTLAQFDAVLVAVDRGGKEGPLFLNPFADDSLFGYFREGRGSRGLAVKPAAVEFVPVRCLPGAESALQSEIAAEIGTDGAIKGKITMELSGLFDQRGRQQLKDMTAKELEVFYKESVNRIGEDAAALKNELSDPKDLTQKLKLSQEFSAQDFAFFQGPIMLIHLPPVPYAFAEVPSPSLAKRRYPFRLPGEAEVRSVVVLEVPAEFQPLYLPTGFSFENDYGNFSFTVSYEPARSSVVIKKMLVFKKKDIALDQYDEFKNIMDSFGITKNNLVLLEKK